MLTSYEDDLSLIVFEDEYLDLLPLFHCTEQFGSYFGA